MENVFQWLASWVADESYNKNGGRGGGAVVRSTELKEAPARNAHNACFGSWSMGAAGSFVRLAGVSGALAIGFGAYGAHGIRQNQEISRERVLAFDSGNRYHLIHSVALLAAPMSKCPLLTGTLLTVGTVVFSGTCYYYAMTGREDFRRLTPYGGLILILAWLSFVA